jgi:hypothetical protein
LTPNQRRKVWSGLAFDEATVMAEGAKPGLSAARTTIKSVTTVERQRATSL